MDPRNSADRFALLESRMSGGVGFGGVAAPPQLPARVVGFESLSNPPSNPP